MPAKSRADSALHTSTITFLFTDIEGSTRLWAQDRERMSAALAGHDAVARAAVEKSHGAIVKMTGDGMCAAFADPSDALNAALALQRALSDPATTNGAPLRVRCGLHAGIVECRDNDYFGPPVNRAARIMAAAYGGQVLVSQAVVDCVREILPAAVSLRDLGMVRLKDLATPEHVYQVVHPELRRDFPALRSLEAIPNNLQQQLTSFVGRQCEMAKVGALLRKSRLVTLVGIGGLGKSRLSLHVGAEVLDDYPDGVWFVELAPLTDDRLVWQAVASVLGVKEEPGRPVAEALLKFVRDRRLLLVLDNCEHLDVACAALATELLQAGPQLRMLATSREPLHVAGEAIYQLPTLSVPDTPVRLSISALREYEAVRLFMDRAVAAQPAFQLTDQNAVAIADICHRLDGIPLALELAAVRVRALTADEIDARLSDRFRLLTGGYRTALPRLQTLRACIDWSYDLLTDQEKRLLQRLSVFAGGWTLEAAETVGGGAEVDAADALDLLTQLVEKSLVGFEASRGRYRLLETVRQYAREKLVENGIAGPIRERHRDYFLALADAAEPKLAGADQAEWLQRLEDEHENLRASLDWSFVETGTRGGLRLCGALQRFWWTRGHFSEGREWCVRFLDKAGCDEQTPVRAKVLNGTGSLAFYQGDFPAAQKLHEESLAIQRALGERRGIARSLGSLGNVAFAQCDFASARALYGECLAIGRELGDRSITAAALGNSGSVALSQRDFASAWTMFEESVEIMRGLGDQAGIAIALVNLGSAAHEQGDYQSAWERYGESLALRRGLGDKLGIAFSLEGLAAAVAALGSPARGARIWSAAERLREEIGSPLAPNDRSGYDRHVAAARAALGDEAAFDFAWRQGRALTLEQAIEAALEKTLASG